MAPAGAGPIVGAKITSAPSAPQTMRFLSRLTSVLRSPGRSLARPDELDLGARSLAVVPSYVADAVHGRATDRGVVSVMFVDVQPAHKGTDSSAL